MTNTTLKLIRSYAHILVLMATLETTAMGPSSIHMICSKPIRMPLKIIVYFDEVEVCNPLAGHAGVHKTGEVYSMSYVKLVCTYCIYRISCNAL